MMTANSLRRSFLLPTALGLLLSAATCAASAQVVPAMASLGNVSGFGTITTVKPDLGFYGDSAVFGISLGGFIQKRPLIGVELRGELLRSGGIEHEEALLTGPRFAPRFGRVSPYVSILGGLANTWRYSHPPNPEEPPPRILGGFGPQWAVAGGVDFHINRQFVFRTGEISYSQTYTKNNWNMTELTVSTGIVYRFN
jgi:ABC-type transport system substrate-binding protein